MANGGRPASSIKTALQYREKTMPRMTREELIDAVIVAYAGAAPDGTQPADVVSWAHSVADARDAHAGPARPARVGGRIPDNERQRRATEARDTVLLMVQSAPGAVYQGGKAALCGAAPCGRNKARAAFDVLVSERVLLETFDRSTGRKTVTLARAVQGVQP